MKENISIRYNHSPHSLRKSCLQSRNKWHSHVLNDTFSSRNKFICSNHFLLSSSTYKFWNREFFRVENFIEKTWKNLKVDSATLQLSSACIHIGKYWFLCSQYNFFPSICSLCAMPTAIIQTFLFALYSNILTRSAFVFRESLFLRFPFIIYYLPIPYNIKQGFPKNFTSVLWMNLSYERVINLVYKIWQWRKLQMLSLVWIVNCGHMAE